MSDMVFLTDNDRVKRLVQILPEETFYEYVDLLSQFNFFSIYLIDVFEEFLCFRKSTYGKFDNPITERLVSSFESSVVKLCDLAENTAFPMENKPAERYLQVILNEEEKLVLSEIIPALRAEYRAMLSRAIFEPQRASNKITYSHGVIRYKDFLLQLESPQRILLMDMLWSGRAKNKARAKSVPLTTIVETLGWTETNVRSNIKSFGDDLKKKNIPMKFQYRNKEVVLVHKGI